MMNFTFISSLFTFSPVTPLFIGVSGGEEFSLSLHPLFTPLHPYRNTLYAIWEEKKPPVPYASGAFSMHQAAKVLPGGGTIEIPFVYISLTAFIRALYQRNR